jgi:hypothetical protein
MTSLLDGIDLHPRDVEAALEGLDTVVRRLAARNDSRAVFPDVYGVITRNVAREVRKGSEGLFLEPAWISRLAGRFAERYFETLAWSLTGQAQDCDAWALAYRAAEGGATIPLDDAALGISAHINFDLALGLWQTIEEVGDTSPEQLARYKHDHDAVNALLAESLPEAVGRLVERYDCPVTPWLRGRALPLTREVALFGLARWRAHVWEDVLALVHAPGEAARQAVSHSAHARALGRAGPRAVAGQRAAPGRARPVAPALPHRAGPGPDAADSRAGAHAAAGASPRADGVTLLPRARGTRVLQRAAPR